MTFFRFIRARVFLALCAIPAAVQGGGYGPQAFTGYAAGTTNLGDGTVIASSNGVCMVTGTTNPYLQLTQDTIGNTSSSFKLPDLDPGGVIAELQITFDLYMASSGTPADGMSVNFGPIPDGNGAGEGGFAMAGGLAVCWDTYNNGNDTPSVEVFADGVSIANFPIEFTAKFGRWAAVVVHWDEDGLDLSYDGTALATNLETPGFLPEPGDRCAFSGRTGGATQHSHIDNLHVTTAAVTPVLTGGPVISEFLADNEETLEDDELDSPDWIEIYNGQAVAVNLAGWCLTDDPTGLLRWQFPAVTVPAFGCLVVFASGKDRNNPAGALHSNFALDKAGGHLALVAPDGTTVVSEFDYGAQGADVSYGEKGNERTLGYLENPTPGAPNSGYQAAGLPAEEVQFDQTGGLFAGQTTLAILPPVSPTAVVRYTTNNTVPGESSPAYGGTPFQISTTTTIRARVFDPGMLPGEIKSRTLIKLAPDLQAFDSALPIVVADSFGFDIDLASNPAASRPFRPVYSVVIDRDPADGLARITAAPDFTGRGGMHVRGQSSSGFPKKQYAWETWDNENEDKKVAILDLPAESDWVLQAPYSDKTLMRNVLAYGCAHDLHRSGGGMRTRFVEFFFNRDGGEVSMADYRGVYVIIEKIKRDSNRVDVAKLNNLVTDPALITGGYIFKKDKEPYSQPWTTATEGIPLDTQDPEILNTAQSNYLRGYINNFESNLHGSGFADPVTGYASYIDVTSFIDKHLMVELFREIDGYRISQYFHKDRGGKILSLPFWDYNLALGNADYNYNYHDGNGDGQNDADYQNGVKGWYHTLLNTPDYYWYPRLFQDPAFVLAYWDRFWELRRSLFSDTSLLARIDTADAELDLPNSAGESAVTRNFVEWPTLGTYLWPNNVGYESRTTHQAEVDWMKNWLTSRLAWVETQSQGIGGPAQPPVWNQYGGAVAAPFVLTMSNPNSWSPAEIVYTTNGSDPRLGGGQIYTGPLTITSPVEIRARVRNGTRWSPLSKGTFAVDTVPASLSNLVVSELDYHPGAPSQAEIDAGFRSAGDFEFVELMNVHPTSSLSLEGVAFVGGITFTFDSAVPLAARFLPPGSRVVLVANSPAFNLRHGASGALVAGVFGGALNNGGERLELIDADESTIQAFTYDNNAPWPADADGNGYSLVLIAPASSPVPDHGDPANWRSSAAPGGSPGGSDAAAFTGDPEADEDHDGLSAYLEFAQGTSDTNSASRTVPRVAVEPVEAGGTTTDHLVFEFQFNLAADELRFAIESCTDLLMWTDAAADFVHLSTTNNGDGTAVARYRSVAPLPNAGRPRWFYRLAVSPRP